MQPMVEELKKLMREGMDVSDPYLHRAYKMRVILGLVSVDSPARMTLDNAAHIRSFRCDWRSRMEGESGGMNHMNTDSDKGGLATRFRGYACTVLNQELARRGDGNVLANDPRLLLTGEQMLALGKAAEEGLLTMQMCGRHGLSPLAELPYFNPCWHYPIPLIHAGIYGVLKVSPPNTIFRTPMYVEPDF
jgi:hypothetical protein